MINTLDNTRTVQAVTLADGTTAFIQHPKGGKFLEGQTITLEDGSTAVVQGLSQVSNLPVSVSSDVENVVNDHSVISDGGHITDGQPVQLEDGTTALLHHTPKEGLQAIQLEDGTTAYITHPSAESLFGEAANLDSTTLSPDHLASQTVIAAGLPDTKTMFFGEKAYRCSFAGCGRLYTTTHHLKVHERSHTGVRPFKCDHEGCGKAFATGYGLKSHVRVHTGEKPYKCPEENCEKAFKTSGDLQKHVRTHTGERPFKCPFEGCDRSFTTSNIRKVHIRTHTGERPYICNEEGCGRAFASATNYKNHIRIHTGEKPYMCTVAGCGKRFTEYSSLYKHHVVHTHSKPYVCNHCGKTYRQTSTLAMHKRTAHGEDVTAESEAQLYQENQASVAVISGEDGDGEPEEKRSKLDFPIQNQTETPIVPENTMIINTTQAQEVVNNSNEIGEGQTAPTVLQGAPQTSTVANVNISQLPPTGNIATITMGEDGQQQIFVITDPAQLEALQVKIVCQNYFHIVVDIKDVKQSIKNHHQFSISNWYM
ncbi:hypothetical protein FSP39_011548 [Pinctada imbricata]|uniref:Zinc finger protein 143 n=1 Tax=Pinctada imbricata TaxID=66713 RepID=A0AA88YIU4_PINIB|nr:hypothetical protein FSP39_011548 [Pinctada imbricata]